MTKTVTIKDLILNGTDEERLALFNFNLEQTDKKIIVKFNLWARYFFPSYFTSRDAPFHNKIDEYNLQCYRGLKKSLTNVIFRGGAKTTRTKLFIAFIILNDTKHFRRYLKILTKDLKNATQSSTDIYNMLVDNRVRQHYPETFKKTVAKREETMSSFTTSTGIKLRAGTVGTDQRGQLQDDARPDFVWFDDFETKKTLKSAIETQAIWDNMEEARTGLSKDGSCVYTCNYISERGNVHKLIGKENELNVVLNVPIIIDGVPTWSDRDTIEDIKQIEEDADDFAGEYLNNPSAGYDVLFDRPTLDEMKEREPLKELAGFRIYKEYDPSSRYGAGADVAGGVGLDSSTTVFIDFDTVPAQVVATSDNNTIKPEIFGDELKRQGDIFGTCLIAVENNYGAEAVFRLKQLYPHDKVFKTQQKKEDIRAKVPATYGWKTHAGNKSSMMFALAKAVEKGYLQLNDKKLIAEAKSYSRDDLMDTDIDPRLTTRHFDLLIACAIAWQMKDFAQVAKEEEEFVQPEQQPISDYFGEEEPEQISEFLNN